MCERENEMEKEQGRKYGNKKWARQLFSINIIILTHCLTNYWLDDILQTNSPMQVVF